MKRAISIIILLSMTLHCASRLGVISYLYEQRHEIAYHVGLIAEIPIAMCGAEYFSKNASLIIHAPNTDSPGDVPSYFASAKEIILFSHAVDLATSYERSCNKPDHNTSVVEEKYSPPLLSIFHPPC